MAPPVAKRRKLSHSESSEEKDVSFSDSGPKGAAVFDDEDLDSDASDEAMQNGVALPEEDEDIENDDLESELAEEDDMSGVEEEQTPNGKQKATASSKENRKTNHRRDTIPTDGVYTAEVYKSNMFKLQVDELLEQVRPKYGKKEAPAESAMRTLKNIIEQIPGGGPLSIPDAQKALKAQKIAIPFPNPQPPKDAKYKLQYERPANINATGSYPLKIATRSGEELAIDLVVTIPASALQEKDYLNHRYFYKRAYYLARIAAGIKSSKEHAFKLSYDYLNGNHLQPIIVVRPSGDGGQDDFSSSKCRIHIVPAVPEKFFPSNKLLPNVNCVRPKGTDEEKTTLKATPFYNSSVQADSSVTGYLKLLHASSSQCDAYKDACVLGRVWLRQRGFGGSIRKGGFGNFEWAAIIAILLQKNSGSGAPALSTSYSSYQLFKATLQFLASKDLVKQPYLFQASNVTLPKHEGTPVLFDGPRNMNVLFKMSLWSYAQLREEARLTMKTLADSTFDQFEATFILKTNTPFYRYDGTLEIPVSALGLESTGENYEQDLTGKCRNLYSTLVRALTDRVTSVAIQLPEEKGWGVDSKRPAEDQAGSVLASFAFDAANASRTVDRGPTPEEKKEAASFRQFWGDKAELRRFQDGNIVESVVWSKDGTASVLEQLVFYIIRRHLGAAVADQARFSSDSPASRIQPDRAQGKSGKTSFQLLSDALVDVEKEIRGLEGLPLQVRQMLAVDPQLRASSVELPFQPSQQLMSQPAGVVIQFEGSGRWPDDLPAIQRTKIAFLLKLSDLLNETYGCKETRVGLENPSQPSQNQGYLDIIRKSGHAFRLRIHHDREATLLERQLKDKSLDGPSRESAALALAIYKRDYLRRPTHTQAVQSLCTRFSALSPSIQLTKKWFASHLLLPHFADELIELLVVRTFLQPYPWPVPASATTGFLRTLFWISRWDWRHTPLIVDFAAANPEQGTQMNSEDVSAIMTRFEAWRRIDPAMNRVVLFAASSLDTEGTTWTDKGKPEKVIAGRMTALAKAAVGLLKGEEERLKVILNGNCKDKSSSGGFDPQTLFVSPLGDYDFLIYIASKFLKGAQGKVNKESVFKNIQNQSTKANSVQDVGYNPVSLFYEELQAVYGSAILWFYDPESSDVIAGLWNPASTVKRGWKVKAGYSTVPIQGKKKNKNKEGVEEREDSGVDVELNKESILNEIARLGGDMVVKVEGKRY